MRVATRQFFGWLLVFTSFVEAVDALMGGMPDRGWRALPAKWVLPRSRQGNRVLLVRGSAPSCRAQGGQDVHGVILAAAMYTTTQEEEKYGSHVGSGF